MGTSSSYPGPTGRTTLLPPWADDVDVGPEDDSPAGEDVPGESTEAAPTPTDDQDAAEPGVPPSPTSPPPPTMTWRTPKQAFGRLASGVGTRPGGSAFRRVGRTYVAASGGSRTAAQSARAGRATTRGLGGFLADGIRNGFRAAAERLGVGHLVGLDAQTALVAFVDLLAPDGALLEEAVARSALIETLSEVFDQYGVDAQGLDALDRLGPADLEAIITRSIVNYVNGRIQHELVNRLEREAIPEADANRLLAEMKDFIGGLARLDFAGVDLVALDWRGSDGQRLVGRLFESAYALLGEEA